MHSSFVVARLGCVAALAAFAGVCSSTKAHHVIGEDRAGAMVSMDAKPAQEMAPKGIKAMFPTKAEAEAAAPLFGCKGAHRMGQSWMPCATHQQGGHAGH